MCVLLASKCVATLWGGVEFVTWLGVSVNSAAPSSLKKLRPLLVSSWSARPHLASLRSLQIFRSSVYSSGSFLSLLGRVCFTHYRLLSWSPCIVILLQSPPPRSLFPPGFDSAPKSLYFPLGSSGSHGRQDFGIGRCRDLVLSLGSKQEFASPQT